MHGTTSKYEIDSFLEATLLVEMKDSLEATVLFKKQCPESNEGVQNKSGLIKPDHKMNVYLIYITKMVLIPTKDFSMWVDMFNQYLVKHT